MLEVIIPHINSKIGTLDMFSNLFGLCDIIAKDGKTFPAEYCNGEYKQVSDFNLHKGTVYHRLNGVIGLEFSEDESVVACDPFYNRTFPVRTVAVIKKDHIKGMDNDSYLENKVAQDFLSVIAETNNKTLRQSLRSDSVSFEVTGIITNRDEIFNSEYTGIDNFFRYEYLYIAIDYNIIVTGNLSCFETYTC